jgi:hypothetical protein
MAISSDHFDRLTAAIRRGDVEITDIDLNEEVVGRVPAAV